MRDADQSLRETTKTDLRNYVHRVLALTMGLMLAVACRSGDSGRAVPVEPAYFPVPDVCSYTQAGPGKTFSRLGGGEWARSNASEERSAFECVGTNPRIHLLSGEDATIEVEYTATGVEGGASIVSIKYTASGNGPIPNETTWRNAFANLVDGVCRQGLEATPPELFRRKLSNLSSYSRPGKGFTENFDVGRGFVSITRESSGANDIKIFVKIFSDIALKIES